MMAAPIFCEVADDTAGRRGTDLSLRRARFGLPLSETLSDTLHEVASRMAVLAAPQRPPHDETATSRVALLEGFTVGIAWERVR